MPTSKEINALAKQGQTQEAYEMALADYSAEPENVWNQRKIGWALYYLIKKEVEEHDETNLFKHLEELNSLSLLNPADDALIFENLLWKIAEYVKEQARGDENKLNQIFLFLKSHSFQSSKGYSYLLRVFIAQDTWTSLKEFLEWWNLDHLLAEDYEQFQLQNGKKIMSLAEQVYIAQSKVLLASRDRDAILEFIPKLERLMDEHPDMLYPGYFCGKLLMATGAERDEALDAVMPFVQKKKTEFWVWQLLAELFKDEPDTQLACYLRAVHCHTQETFIGKIRMKLVEIYANRGELSRAKFHLDKVTHCYLQQGWHLPFALQNIIRQGWVNTTQADPSDGLDYKPLTDAILCRDANESLAIVAYIDNNRHAASLIYGFKKRTLIKLSQLPQHVREGYLLKLKWTPGSDDRINLVGTSSANKADIADLNYIRELHGTCQIKGENPFAFLKAGGLSCFISPAQVQKSHLQNGDTVTVLAALNYNNKKADWTWSAITVKKQDL